MSRARTGWQGRKAPLGVAALLALIVVAHLALWASDRVTPDIKLRLTVLNALGWAVVLVPALAVVRWRDAHLRANRAHGRVEQRH